MQAIVATHGDAENPISALSICELPEPEATNDWVKVEIKAAALNHHDVWTLRGQATPSENLPIVLGSDGAGITSDGTPVIVHAVIGDPSGGDETLDPKRSLLSEIHDGTFANFTCVPKYNLIPKPDWLTFEQAACLPTAWLTAYRMLFSKSGLTKGDTVLIQGASGGVASALISLANAAGIRVWVTTRSEDKKQYAQKLGAAQVFEPNAKLPEKVDVVMETVGQATWAHSMRSLKPGGRIIVSGATTGANPPADLNRLFFLQLQIIGSTMGSKTELIDLISFLEKTGLRPEFQGTYLFSEARNAFEKLIAGDVQGKLVLLPD